MFSGMGAPMEWYRTPQLPHLLDVVKISAIDDDGCFSVRFTRSKSGWR